MYTGFNTYLGYEDKVLLENQFIVISDFNIDGNFVLHHFISQFLKNDANVVLFGFSQTLTHYSNACHKLGANISAAAKSKQFVYIDILQCFFDGFLTKDDDGDESSIFSNSSSPQFSLKKLYQMMKSNIPLNNPTVVLIDDICAMVNIGVSVQSINDLIHYCKVLSTQKNNNFIISSHCDEEDCEYSALLAQLGSYATLEIHVKGLYTGFSRDLSGEMNIVRYSDSLSSVITKRLHFKLFDKDVKLFAPGMSTAVL